jgi:hypothetical protein
VRRPRVIVHAPRVDRPGAREVEAHGETHALLPLRDAEVAGRLVSSTLHWQQPRVFQREWQLVSERGEHLLLHGDGISRRKLVAETPEATWVLTRSWGGSVTLADPEGRELASVPHGWFWRWRLELPSGPALRLRRRWGGDHLLEDEEGHELLRLRRRFSFLRFQAEVSLAEAVGRRNDLLQLLAVTFFAWLSKPRGHGH